MLIDVERLSDGKRFELYVPRVVKFGGRVVVGGVAYKRVPSVLPPPKGAFEHGPITMFSEPRQGEGDVDAPHYDPKSRFAVFESQSEINEYKAKTKDTPNPVCWTR